MKLFRRALALTCSILLVLTIAPTWANAQSEQSYTFSQDIGIGLTSSWMLSKDESSSRQMFLLKYKPNLSVTPIVYFGSKLYGKSTITEAIASAEKNGYTVLAAVNADYFDLSNGLSSGLVIQNGRLCSSDGAWNAVAFFKDGTAMAGAPKLSISYTGAGVNGSVYAINKLRTQSGVYLYTSDFSSNTHFAVSGTSVILQPLKPGNVLRLGQPLELTVKQVVKGSDPIAMDENTFVLSVQDGTYGTALDALSVGQTITVNTSTEDPAWAKAVYACGGGNMLVKNAQLTSDATSDTAPRSVLGVYPDGSFVILACDGRQSGLSDGISLKEAATKLISMGCTSVVNLDGGGSTAVSLRSPGQPAAMLVSSPSDGSERGCANYILFVNTGDKTAPASKAAVYPQNSVVLAGSSLDLSALSVNQSYYPTGAITGAFAVKSGGGTVKGNTFYSGATAGETVISYSSPSISSIDAHIQVVNSIGTMSFVNQGSRSALSSLKMSPGDTADLSIFATDGLRPIVTQDSLFTYSVSGGIGTIDANGVFTATNVAGVSGSIFATYGDKTIQLPVTVGQAPTLIEGFESLPQYPCTMLYPASTVAGSTVIQQPESARYGFSSLQLSYQISGTTPNELIKFYRTTPLELPSGAITISLMAKGNGVLAMDFSSDCQTIRVPINIKSQTWQTYKLAVPQGATSILGFSAAGSDELSGNVAIDQVMCHFSTGIGDSTPPTVSLVSQQNGQLLLSVTDDFPYPVTQDMITVTIDGDKAAFQYDQTTGQLSLALPQDDSMHRITVTAKDYFYNESRFSTSVGAVSSHVFSDMKGHWAYTAAEYLCSQGIFSADTKFNPSQNTTNAMSATLISRYLGIDTSQYENVVLPYADAAQIPSWALPHAKALYAKGIMKGTAEGNKLYFLPNNETTRAQIMTLLGRTISRGYTYGSAPFDDMNQVPDWALDHVNLLFGMGVINGYSGTNSLRPTAVITRAEFASLLFKML